MLKKLCCAVLAGALMLTSASDIVCADIKKDIDTKVKYNVYAEGKYSNWEGVSTVSQFKDEKGNYCYAYNNKGNVIIIKTKGGKTDKKITIKMPYKIFGAVTCDSEGNFYLVTGKENATGDPSAESVFISKYDAAGNHIKTVGDNGSSSLAYYYGSDFYGKIPFDGGNCDVAINGDILAVNYAREMISGHQSNSVFAVNTKTMTKVNAGNIYNSHSFGQRAIACGDKFVFASEGDCFPRTFNIAVSDPKSGNCTEYDVFDFWVEKDAYNTYNMFVVNENFAHIGDLAAIDDHSVAFVGTSAKSLSSKAKKETEQIFIQTFDITKDLTQNSAYFTSGTRSGIAGNNGDQNVTNYGVKWVTNSKNVMPCAQLVATKDGRLVVLYMKKSAKTGKYMGVYYKVLDKYGRSVKKEQLYSKTALLNECETPICVGNTVYWTANASSGKNAENMHVFKLKIE